MKKIVIIADSLSLPRPESLGDIRYEETYPYLMDFSFRSKYGVNAPMFMEKGKRARTITEVAQDWREYVSWRKPQIVIVHAGIVDCAPRIFTPKQREFVHKIRVKLIREFLLNFVTKNRQVIIKALPKKVYTTLGLYRNTANKLIELAKQDDVQALIFINIISPPDFLEKKSPGFQANVEQYNEVLAQCKKTPRVHVIDLNTQLNKNCNAKNYLLPDGMHLSVEGNCYLAKVLEALVAQELGFE